MSKFKVTSTIYLEEEAASAEEAIEMAQEELSDFMRHQSFSVLLKADKMED